MMAPRRRSSASPLFKLNLLTMTIQQRLFLSAAVSLLLLTSCRAWVGPLPQTNKVASSLALHALPEGYQEYGNERIYSAAALCGASKEQISIVWKGDRIVVTVSGDVYVSNPLPFDEEQDDEEYDEHEEGVEYEECEEEPIPEGAVDVATFARAINSALDDDGVGVAIAEAHEIEVTTPGASDELSGVMWEAYKGFPVIAQHKDPKTEKIKTVEGKLVERNDEFTILNIKGRMKKLKNQDVLSVKLPKAKKEKGVR